MKNAFRTELYALIERYNTGGEDAAWMAQVPTAIIGDFLMMSLDAFDYGLTEAENEYASRYDTEELEDND